MAVEHGVATAEEVDTVVDDLYALARDPRRAGQHPAHRAGLGREARRLAVEHVARSG